MRPRATAQTIGRFMEELARHVSGPGRVYFTGGATAVIFGWRKSTIDIEVRLDPEPRGALRALATLKDDLQVNLNLASPQDVIPPLPDWPRRALAISQHGSLAFFHYDPYAQALAMIDRGHAQDLDDVRALFTRRLIDPQELKRLFEASSADLVRYPAIDADDFRLKVATALTGLGETPATPAASDPHGDMGLPGADLVETGLRDLARGIDSFEALLVCVGAARLARAGVAIPPAPLPDCPEHRLYDLLCATRGRSAYGDYNALIRRLVSYERALESARGQLLRQRERERVQGNSGG